MDLLPLVYGAIAGLAIGVMWGRFERAPETRPNRTAWQWLVSFVGFAIAIEVFERIPIPQLPSTFWVTLIVVAWFVKPLGERLRERSR